MKLIVVVLIALAMPPYQFEAAGDAYVVNRSGNYVDRIPVYRLWTMNADGSNKTILFENTESQFTHPHPSPDGRMIVGVVYTEDLNGDGLRNEEDLQASAIAIIDADSSDFRILTDAPGEVDSHPAWSPDGSRILFTSSEGCALEEMWDLFTVNVDGTNRQRLTNTAEVSEGDPHWGSNGWIAFVRAPLDDVVQGKPTQIYIMDENGKHLTQVSNVQPGGRTLIGFPTGPYDPVWDPAGQQLAWSLVPSTLKGVGRIADFDLIIFDRFGREIEISPNPYPDLMPRWSPDGKKLVFWILFGRESRRWVFDDVYIINVDGSERKNLTWDLPDEACMPDWFPDGRIIFTSVLH